MARDTDDAWVTPFSEHGLVDLLLGTEDRRAARVTAVGRRHVLLCLFPASAAIPVGPDFRTAVLEGVGPEGVSRVEGAVASVASIAGRQALTFKPADPSALRRRRAAARVALDRGVLLSRGEGGDDCVVGRMLDVSGGGMRVRSAASFAIGETVTVTFDPGMEGRTSGVEGRVLRVEPGGDCALAFEDGRHTQRFWVDRLIAAARTHT